MKRRGRPRNGFDRWIHGMVGCTTLYAIAMISLGLSYRGAR
jgi:hypothetical protein